MTSAFERALAVGQRAAMKIHSLPLTYTRAGFDAVPLTGSQGKKLFKIQEPGKPIVMVQSVDFLIKAADLVIDDTATEPERYDEISHTIGTQKKTYKVLPMGREIPIFEYTDSGETVFRIHTKFDRQETV